jgi:SH3-like domain-containing protein
VLSALFLALSVLAGTVPASASQPVQPVMSPADGGIVKAADLSRFDPGNIISDAVFFNSGTMSEAQIKAFIDGKISACKTGTTCLKNWRGPSQSRVANPMCRAFTGSGSETAASLIYKVSQACGINPQVILVTLEKEQSLITKTAPSAYNFNFAMGYNCPDTTGCTSDGMGFSTQIYGGAYMFKRYANPPGTSQYFTWYAPGKTWDILYNPDRSCGSSRVLVANQATANLYYYTPYQPNAASLRAGYGEGDRCSTYGNRNFYNFFTDWFGSTQRTACDQPPYNEVRAASGTFTTGAVTGRSTAFVECETGTTRVAAGTRVTAAATWRNWTWIDVSGSKMWVPTGFLTPWDPCSQPPYEQVRATSGSYLVGAVTARPAPFVECGTGGVALSEGTTVTAVATWANWTWIETAKGRKLWVPTGYLRRTVAAPADACTQPPFAEVRGGSGSAVSGAVTARTAPFVECETGAVALADGATVTVAATWRNWSWVDVKGSMLWVPTGFLRQPSACIQPPYSEVRGGSGSFLTGSVTARPAPFVECGTGAVDLADGTAVTVAATWRNWSWVDAGGTMLWVPTGYLRPVPTCVQPPFAEVRGGSGTYLTGAVTARSAPYVECSAGTVGLADGTRVTVAAVWRNWSWVDAGGRMLWVPTGFLR